MDIEIWKDIKGFLGYQVSNMGRVRSFRTTNPNKTVSTKPKILRTFERNKKLGLGYIAVNLRRGKGIETMITVHVHRLVLDVFVGPCPVGMEACHNNGIRSDNRLENLRWDTKSHNRLDQRKHGTAPWGENNNLAKLTEDQVKEIRILSENGESFNSIGRKYGISGVHIGRIIKRKCWFHV